MYLKEIQGLRIVAALLVAIYHIWFQRVSGGVDAFFIIAGFFLFRTLFKKESPQWQDIFTYYKRTIARIAPSASVIVVCTCLGFMWINMDSLWSDQIKSAVAALTFTENWWLSFSSVDYLAQGQIPSPFQQMWALSVQMQIYIAMPILLLFSALIARKLPFGKYNLQIVVGVLLLASFIYALLATYLNQPRAYFDTLARVWEFLAGVLLASSFSSVKLNSATAKILGYTCLFILVTFAAVIPVGQYFPGVAALVPVIATSGIIIAASNNANLSLLNAKPLQRLGDLSFTFYLWHWPLLIAYRQTYGVSEVGIIPGLGIILLAGILAHVTYTFIESPFRKSSFVNGRPLLAFVASAIIFIPAFAATGLWAVKYVSEKQEAENALAAFRNGEITNSLIPATIIAKSDTPASYSNGCNQRWSQSEVLECTYGNEEGEIVVVLVGGSHSLQWLPSLRQIARTEKNLKIISITKGNCPFTLSGDQLNLPEEEVCLTWNTNAIARIKEIQPNAIITLLTSTRESAENLGDFSPEGFFSAWDEFSSIPILAIRDNPRAEFDFLDCVDRVGTEANECSVPRSTTFNQEPFLLSELPDNVHPIDLSDSFCDQEQCSPVRNGFMVYRDSSHITATYARFLAPSIQSELSNMLRFPIGFDNALADSEQTN